MTQLDKLKPKKIRLIAPLDLFFLKDSKEMIEEMINTMNKMEPRYEFIDPLIDFLTGGSLPLL